MFGDLGFGELIGLGVLALILVGPDKLPSVASQTAKFIKKARAYATTATDSLKENLGPGYEDLKPEDLHPKNFLKKTLADVIDEEGKQVNELRKAAKLDPYML